MAHLVLLGSHDSPYLRPKITHILVKTNVRNKRLQRIYTTQTRTHTQEQLQNILELFPHVVIIVARAKVTRLYCNNIAIIYLLLLFC